MRFFRFLLVLLPIVLALTVAAAWVLPGMLDWDRYRSTVEALATAALGRPVRIEGRITLELLPEPLLTADSVSIDAEGGLAISAHELRLRIAPGALFQGTIDARELVLHEPVMRVPWPLPPGALAFHRPPWLTALSARIEGGTLAIGAVKFIGIDATLSASDADGGYRLAGTAQRNGDWRFTARLSGLGRDGAAGLDVSVDGMGERQGLGGRFAGQFDGAGQVAGRLDAQGPDLSRLLPAPSVPFSAGGRLTLASGLLAADDLALDIGGSPARGAISLRLSPQPRLDLALAASRLDLDAWLPALLKSPAADYPVGVDLSAEAAQLFGGLLRRLRVAFDMPAVVPNADSAESGMVVREANAILPGEAVLHLAGKVQRHPAARPTLSGEIKIEAPEFRTTLHWLNGGVLGPLSGLPEGVLRTIDLAGTVAGDTDRLSISALHGMVDGASIDGSLSIGFGPRLLLVANVETAQLVLDPWLPRTWSVGDWSVGRTILGADLARMLPAFDADLRLSAKRAQYRGVDITALSGDLALDEGRLRLRRVDGLVEGVQAHLAGLIAEGGRVEGGQVTLATKDVSVVAPLLPVNWRLPGLWRGAAKLQIDAAGPPAALALKLTGELGDLRIESQPVLDLPHESWAGPLTLRHPGAPRLFETLDMSGAPAWLGDGSFSLVAGLVGAPRQLRAEKLEIVAGSLRADGALLLDSPADGPKLLSGRINAETLPLPEIYMRGLDPLPLSWLHEGRANVQVTAARVLVGLAPVLERAQGTVVLNDGLLSLNGLNAALSGGTVTGTASIATAAAPPVLQLQASWSGVAIMDKVSGWPLDLSAGQSDGEISVAATGHSPAALMATLQGTARISVNDGVITGFDFPALDDALKQNAADPAVASALAGHATGFRRLIAGADIQYGRFNLRNTSLESAAGRADFTGSFDLAGAALDVRISLHPDIPGTPDLALRMTGPIEAVRRIPELAGITTWRAQLSTR